MNHVEIAFDRRLNPICIGFRKPRSTSGPINFNKTMLEVQMSFIPLNITHQCWNIFFNAEKNGASIEKVNCNILQIPLPTPMIS